MNKPCQSGMPTNRIISLRWNTVLQCTKSALLAWIPWCSMHCGSGPHTGNQTDLRRRKARGNGFHLQQSGKKRGGGDWQGSDSAEGTANVGCRDLRLGGESTVMYDLRSRNTYALFEGDVRRKSMTVFRGSASGVVYTPTRYQNTC